MFQLRPMDLNLRLACSMVPHLEPPKMAIHTSALSQLSPLGPVKAEVMISPVMAASLKGLGEEREVMLGLQVFRWFLVGMR